MEHAGFYPVIVHDLCNNQVPIIKTDENWITASEIDNESYFRSSEFQQIDDYELYDFLQDIREYENTINSISMVSSESSILLLKLWNEGIRHLIHKFSEEKLNYLIKLNNIEYPGNIAKYSSECSLLILYKIYEIIKTGKIDQIVQVVDDYPDLINHHALILAVSINSVEIFNLLLGHLQRHDESIEGFLIDCFNEALIHNSRDIIDLYFDEQISVNVNMVYYMLKSALKNKNQDLVYKILTSYPQFIEGMVDISLSDDNLDITNLVKLEVDYQFTIKQIDEFTKHLSKFQKELLTLCEISNEDLRKINDLNKINLLLSVELSRLYKFKTDREKESFMELAEFSCKCLEIIITDEADDLNSSYNYNIRYNPQGEDFKYYAASFAQLAEAINRGLEPESLEFIEEICKNF